MGAVLRARKYTIATVLAAAVALALVANALLPRSYTASGSLLVDMRSSDPLSGTVLASLSSQSTAITQADVLRSERVVIKAVQALGLAKNDNLQKAWQEDTNGRGSFDSWLAQSFQPKLVVLPSRDSNVIDVAFTDRSPEFAAAMVNAVMTGYVDTVLELRVEPAKQYNVFFDDRAKSARAEVERAQKALSTFQQANGLVSDERVDIESSRLSELSTQVVVLQGLVSESANKQRQASSNAQSSADILNNPSIVGLRAELSRQETALQELNSRLGDQHPQVQQMRVAVGELRSSLGRETSRIAASLQTNNTVNQSRLAELQASLEAQRQRVLKLKQQRDASALLQRDVENAQHAFDAIATRATESGLQSRNTQTNVSVLKQASEPTRSSTPKTTLNLLLASMFGLALGVAAAFMREFKDRTIYGEEDVVSGLRHPVMATLPVISTAKSNRGNRPRIAFLKARVLQGGNRAAGKA